MESRLKGKQGAFGRVVKEGATVAAAQGVAAPCRGRGSSGGVVAYGAGAASDVVRRGSSSRRKRRRQPQRPYKTPWGRDRGARRRGGGGHDGREGLMRWLLLAAGASCCASFALTRWRWDPQVVVVG